MAEMHDGGNSAGDNLGLRALLYVSESMDAGEAAQFEQDLGSDQRSREALQEAVQFLQRWGDSLPQQPDVSYRQRVRERLLHGGTAVVKRLTAPRMYRGHPLIWGAVGAIAAACLVAVLLAHRSSQQTAAPLPRTAVEPRRHTPVETAANEQTPMTSEELELWADLPRSRHLLKVHHEESERKRRSELQMRIVLRDGMGGGAVVKEVPSN